MNPYITRNTRERYVMARIHRHKKMHAENFKLKEYGTWELAEAAALEWVQKTLPNLPTKLSAKNRMTKRNHSGVVGVHFTTGERTLNSGNKAEYPSYIARWPGCKGGVSWMLSTYNGEESAFIHAVLCRRLESKDRAHIEEVFRTLTSVEKAEILKLKKEPNQ